MSKINYNSKNKLSYAESPNEQRKGQFEIPDKIQMSTKPRYTNMTINYFLNIFMIFNLYMDTNFHGISLLLLPFIFLLSSLLEKTRKRSMKKEITNC